VILAWKRGDPIAIADLTPWLEAEVRRQLRRLLPPPESPGARVDASAVIDATLLQVAADTADPRPGRVHLMAAVAPLLRRILIDEIRRLAEPVSVCRRLFDGREGQIEVLELDRALSALTRQDATPARIAELRLFAAMSIEDVAEVLESPVTSIRGEWDLARAWIHRHRTSDREEADSPEPARLMEPARWTRMKSLFQSVLGRSAEERAAHLQAQCNDPQLRTEVEALVRCHHEAGAALGTEALHSPVIRESGDFPGSDRFQLEHRLGSGGFGVVYRAFDRKRNRVVALKTLSPTNTDALYRLKREFRSLADLTHPNLIRLYELFSEGTLWFFTMELIEGVSFLDYVRPGGHTSFVAADETRLRASLLQLAEGVLTLHQARRLHRDLKPSNVLVSADGTVRILDFGLASDLSQPAADQSSHIVGTPAYMAPEHGTGEPLTEASDWYSVGTMLYEALTGRVPFAGGFLDILMQKRAAAAPSPLAALGGGVPDDLDELCTALLDPEAAKRPAGRDVLRRLQPLSPSPRARYGGSSRRHLPFLGRQKEMDALRGAFARARAGRTTIVAVHGSSGIGKTALVRSFLDELARDEPGLPLFRARCYEQESVPFKALDGIVDNIAGYLRRLPQAGAEGLLPRDVLPLARLFPVLRNVPAVASARRRVLEVIDTQELRRRAFGALRELLARMGEHSVPVLFIDDLHWGDLDSAVLLSEVLRPPDPPSLMIVGTYRTEEAETSPFLKHILPLRPLAGSALDVSELNLTPIEQDEATDLAHLLLGSEWPDSATRAAAIARESGGNPFLLDELASYERTRSGRRRSRVSLAGHTRRALRFDEVVRARLAQLPRAHRQVLEAVCLAGQPVDESVVAAVAGLPGTDSAIADALKQERFVRTRIGAQATMLEPYHDRIREAVRRRISPSAARSCHGALAAALEQGGQSDPEALACHYEAAGDSARAADFALRAADRAVESLAFEHAARLFMVVLRLRPAHVDLQAVRIRLAEALGDAGRSAESAPYFVEAAAHARGLEAQEMQRRATQQFLTSGHIQAGMEVMNDLMTSVGMRMPASRARTLASLAWNRGLLVLRGTRFRRRKESDIPPLDLIKLDTCWSVTVGLMFVRPLTALMLQARHVRLALKLGEPYRVSRALALDAGFMAASGVKRSRTTESLLKQSHALANEIANPHAIAVSTLAGGFVRFFQGRWIRALEGLDAGETMLRERCTGVAWEMHATQLYSMWCLYHLGRVHDIERRLEPLLEDVRRRRDLFLEAGLCTMFLTFLAVARDDPAVARRQLERISELRLDEQFTVQHFWDLEARVLLALYEGDAEAAFAAVRSRSQEFTQSGLARIQQNRLLSSFWQGRTALGAAEKAAPPRRLLLLRQAHASAARVRREGTDWGDGLFRLLKAGIAISERNHEAALAHLTAGQKAFAAAEFVGPAAMAARLRCGELTGGTEGEAMVTEARSWFEAQGFARPDRFAAVYLPQA
jgi:hypothetical protein